MTALMKRILEWRARGLVSRVVPYVEPRAHVIDIGWGTGHNGERLRQVRQAEVAGLDVVDISVTGPKPQLYDGRHLPFPDDSFDVSLLIYTLHYVEDPLSFLREVKRVTRKRVLIIQTTCRGAAGRSMHRANEWLFGKAAFQVARACGLVGPAPFSMLSKHDFSMEDILECARSAGLTPEASRLEPYGGFLPIGRATCAFAKNGHGR